MQNLDDVTTGRYAVITASGTGVIVDFDKMQAFRVPGLVDCEEGYLSNQFMNDQTPFSVVDFGDIVVGERMSFVTNDPNMWGYHSTTVRSIEQTA